MRQTVEEMLGYFNQIRRVYANELNLKFTNENFSPNEISILILLSNNPSINTSSQLCTILGVSKGLISRSIDVLVEKGYIICAKDDADKRIQRLSFSPQAAPVIQKLNEEVTKMNNEVLQDISKEELQQAAPEREVPPEPQPVNLGVPAAQLLRRLELITPSRRTQRGGNV